jgi:DnaJ family protein C protein 28
MASPNRKKRRHQDRLKKLPDRLEAYQTPAEASLPKKKLGREKVRLALVERLLQEAIENGEFDNLPGKGKPLNLNENPYLEPGQELAFGLLKRNDFAPEWIERDKEIRQGLVRAREQLQRAWQLRCESPAYEGKWQAAVTRFETQLVKLNRKIDSFNLVVPVVSLQRSRLRLDAELQRQQQASECD